MQDLVADVGDWVEFEYKPLQSNGWVRHRGFVLDTFFINEVFRIQVPNVGKFRVPFDKVRLLPPEFDAEGAIAIADFALDTNDEAWFRDLMKFKFHEPKDGDQ